MVLSAVSWFGVAVGKTLQKMRKSHVGWRIEELVKISAVRPQQLRHIELFLPERPRRIHLGGALSWNPAGGHRGRGEQRRLYRT